MFYIAEIVVMCATIVHFRTQQNIPLQRFIVFFLPSFLPPFLPLGKHKKLATELNILVQ
jgi:hypothetical protein